MSPAKPGGLFARARAAGLTEAQIHTYRCWNRINGGSKSPEQWLAMHRERQEIHRLRASVPLSWYAAWLDYTQRHRIGFADYIRIRKARGGRMNAKRAKTWREEVAAEAIPGDLKPRVFCPLFKLSDSMRAYYRAMFRDGRFPAEATWSDEHGILFAHGHAIPHQEMAAKLAAMRQGMRAAA